MTNRTLSKLDGRRFSANPDSVDSPPIMTMLRLKCAHRDDYDRPADSSAFVRIDVQSEKRLHVTQYFGGEETETANLSGKMNEEGLFETEKEAKVCVPLKTLPLLAWGLHRGRLYIGLNEQEDLLVGGSRYSIAFWFLFGPLADHSDSVSYVYKGINSSDRQ